MPVTLTVVDVPEETRDELADRAAGAGQSLEEYLRARLIELARGPGMVDFWKSVDQRVRNTGTFLSGDEILALSGRDGR